MQARGRGVKLKGYKMSPTLAKFHASTKRVKAISGPVGSGKTVGLCWEIWFRACYQQPSPVDDIRYSRWAFIRNTYWELEKTTLKTWMDWFGETVIPPPYARYVGKPSYTHTIHIDPTYDEDGNLVEAGLHLEVIFIALDRPEDVKKLGSLEITGAAFNEARELIRDVIGGVSRRIGRYPSSQHGGPSYPGMLLDTNMPSDNHWWYEFAEVHTPDGWEFYRQPGGLDESAENIENLPGGRQYYLDMLNDLTEEEANVYVHAKYGTVTTGKPVFGDLWNDKIMVSESQIEPIEGRRVVVGLDYGLTPAAVFGQDHPSGQWRILRELCANCGADQFAPLMLSFIREEFPKHDLSMFEFYGDPSVKRNEVDMRTVADAFMAVGIYVRPSPCNNVWGTRKRGVERVLQRMVMGEPGLLLDPSCTMLRRGFNGAYSYKKIPMSGGRERIIETPEKSDESHPHDALQYLLLGGGEYFNMKAGENADRMTKVHKSPMKWSPLGRR